MLVLLHPEQAAQVRQIAADLDVSEEEATRLLLSGPLLTMAEWNEQEPSSW